MSENKGFTLIELLAVIVVLAIILGISLPSIAGIIKNSVKNAFSSNAKLVIKELDYKRLENDGFDPTSIDETNIKSSLNLSSDNYEKLDVSLSKGQIYILIVGKNKWAGVTAYGTFKNMNVVNSDEYVSDTPIIDIIGDINTNIKIGQSYVDLGATAFDGKDGALDISSTVIRDKNNNVVSQVDTSAISTYTITYKAVDSDSNESTATRTVNVLDNVPPVISLNGNNKVYITQGDTYTDAGATATDVKDGDITSLIVITSNLNVNVAGVYTITYTVTDSDYNTTTVTRTIDVADLWNGTIATSFASGTGSSTDPYIIKSSEQLAYLSEQVNNGNTFEGKYLSLDANLDLTAIYSNNTWSGSNWTPIGNATYAFKGTFDGNNNAIEGLYINNNGAYVGFFGNNGGILKNVNLSSGYITGSATVTAFSGAIAGWNSGTVDNCTSSVSLAMTGSNYIRVGGLVGTNAGTISNSENVAGSVKGTETTSTGTLSAIGGIVGQNLAASVIDGCNNISGFVTSISAGYLTAGGIIGYNSQGTIINSSNKASVTTTASTYGAVGGIAGGTDTGTIRTSYNNGAITNTSAASYPNTGGVVGYSVKSTIDSCYNTGAIKYIGSAVTDTRIGGVVGTLNTSPSTLTNSYNIGTVTATNTGTTHLAGIIGMLQNSATASNSYVSTSITSTVLGGNESGGTYSTCTAVAANTLKTMASTLGSAFVADTKNINGGYPILTWQNQ